MVTELHELHEAAYIGAMQKPFFTSTDKSPFHVSVEVQIPEELEFFLAETAEDLEISPEELVQQAVGSYCREKLGGRHE